MCIITYSFCNARTYFDILVIFFYSAWKASFMDWQFSSRKTLKITRNSKDLLLRILWNTFLSNLIKIALVDSVRTTRFCVSYTKIGFTMFWIRTQLEFSGFNPNRNRPRIVNQCFFRELFEERNSRLKSGQRNAKFPTNTWYSYHGKSVFGLPFLTVTSFQHQLPWIWIQNICKERQHKHHYCNFSRVFYLLPYTIITELWSIKQDNQVFNHS